MPFPTLKLNTGYEIPMIGMGTWHHGPKEEIKDALRFAIRNGYRHIDGAHAYLNEAEIGEVYTELLDNGEVKREELFVASKLWNVHHHPDHVEEALRTTLKKLNLDYLDLYYIHFPTAFKYCGDELRPEDDDGRVLLSDDDFVDTWKAMEKLVEKGLVRSIGVCNFNSVQLRRIIAECKTKPAALQIESNPRFHNDILRRFCEKQGIVIVGYSPFGSPDLGPIWGTQFAHVLEDKVLKEIATKHGKSTAQVVLKWQLQRNVVVIPKSVIETELLDNLKIFDFELDESDLERISKLDRNMRKIDPVKTLKDGSTIIVHERSKFYSFRHVETEECLADLTPNVFFPRKMSV